MVFKYDQYSHAAKAAAVHTEVGHDPPHLVGNSYPLSSTAWPGKQVTDVFLTCFLCENQMAAGLSFIYLHSIYRSVIGSQWQQVK